MEVVKQQIYKRYTSSKLTIIQECFLRKEMVTRSTSEILGEEIVNHKHKQHKLLHKTYQFTSQNIVPRLHKSRSTLRH